MGGSNSMFPFMMFGAQQQQPQTPPQYSNDQLLSYARENNTNSGQLEKYATEIKNQLNNGTYQDPYKVWQAVRDGQFKSEQEKNQQEAMMAMLQSQSDSNSFNGG